MVPGATALSVWFGGSSAKIWRQKFCLVDFCWQLSSEHRFGFARSFVDPTAFAFIWANMIPCLDETFPNSLLLSLALKHIVSVQKPNRKLFSTCPRALPSSWRSVLLAAVSSNSHENFHWSFSICGLSSRLISSLEFYSDILLWELAAGALLICSKLQSCFLTKVKSFQHYRLKTGSKLMTASTEWFQLVSIRKPNRKLFSACPRAYAKQLTQCLCGRAASSNSHLKFQWPIQ